MFTYTAHVIDTNNVLHAIRLTAKGSQSVKTAARKLAEAQGITVKYVESFFVTAA